MPRDLPIGNGSLLINFDQDYHIRDIYYPYVGEFNHTLGHYSRFGVWADGYFSWLDSSNWSKSLDYIDKTLITRVTANNPKLGIEIVINDAVDYSDNIYLRKITVRNLSNHDIQTRLYISNDFHLLESKFGDTAYYDPITRAIIHYKKNQYFLINLLKFPSSSELEDQLRYGIEDFAIGIQDFNGAEGTWRDAEDGILSMDSVADGSVDSTISIHLDVPTGKESIAYYWMTAGRSLDEVNRLNDIVIEKSPEHFIGRTTEYWKAWISKGESNLVLNQSSSTGITSDLLDLYDRSLLILRTQIDNNGAITAANDHDPIESGMDGYSYVWHRDAAIIAYALDEAGYFDITERFFIFCADTITPEGYFLHKYNPDRSVGSSWHPLLVNGQVRFPIQEDSTALVIWAFWHHFSKSQNFELARSLLQPLVIKAGNFMLKYRDKKTGLPKPSYDLWEERYGIHTFTSAAVYAGLKSAARFARTFGENVMSENFESSAEEVKKGINNHLYSKKHNRFLRTLFPDRVEDNYDLTIDSSLYSTFAFGVYDAKDVKVVNTMDSIIKSLSVKTNIGGIARYENDHLHRVSTNDGVPGNPWIICSLWLAQYLIAKGTSMHEALKILQWVSDHSLKSGVIPEQLHPYTGRSLSVSPLSWSHGEYILTMHRLLKKIKSIP